MSRARLLMLVLLAVFAVQWAVPASLLVRGWLTLSQGQRYYFRTAPVDPVDAFRGRYVVLDFDAARVPAPPVALPHESRVYVPLRVGADRFARLGAPSPRPPPGPYLEARVARSDGETLWLRLPFDRYYLDERLAPEAERVVREASGNARRASSRAYVAVKVRQGHAVLEELFIDDLPVHKRLQR